MQVNLFRDDCPHWKFYADFLPGKELAVWHPGNKWNATAMNRLRYAIKNGYLACTDHWHSWNLSRDQIYAINTSCLERQGEPMNPAYFDFPEEKHIVNTCDHHRYELITVKNKCIVAYAIVHVAGELMNISTILGHAAHLKDGIMLPLMAQIQQTAIDLGCKAVTYYLWHSGTEGLQYHKHSVGFEPQYLNEFR